MKNLNEFGKLFFCEEDKYEGRKTTLQNRLEKAQSDLYYLKLKKPTPENIIKPLALAIQKELKAKAYYVVDSDIDGTKSKKSKYAFSSLEHAIEFQDKNDGDIVNFYKALDIAKEDF